MMEDVSNAEFDRLAGEFAKSLKLANEEREALAVASCEDDGFADMVDLSLEEALGELNSDDLMSTLSGPSRRQAFKAVVNLIEAFEELQRTVPAEKRDTPAYRAYQQRIFEVMLECLRHLVRSRCLFDQVAWYKQFVQNLGEPGGLE